MDWFIVIGLLIVGFFLGRIYEIIKIANIIIDEMEDDTEIKIEKVRKLKTEKHGDILFLYDDQDTFVCQGSTIDELAKLSQQYKNIKYAAVIHENKIFTFIDGIATEKA